VIQFHKKKKTPLPGSAARYIRGTKGINFRRPGSIDRMMLAGTTSTQWHAPSFPRARRRGGGVFHGRRRRPAGGFQAGTAGVLGSGLQGRSDASYASFTIPTATFGCLQAIKARTSGPRVEVDASKPGTLQPYRDLRETRAPRPIREDARPRITGRTGTRAPDLTARQTGERASAEYLPGARCWLKSSLWRWTVRTMDESECGSWRDVALH